jgi:hypothetical protein
MSLKEIEDIVNEFSTAKTKAIKDLATFYAELWKDNEVTEYHIRIAISVFDPLYFKENYKFIYIGSNLNVVEKKKHWWNKWGF